MMHTHSWDVSVEEAYRIQEDLKASIVISKSDFPIAAVAGIDVCYEKGTRRAACVIAVCSYPDLALCGYSSSQGEITFPYTPGLFAFREGPLIERTFISLRERPDVFLFDGQGICHPRGIGIASHMGVYLDIASVGCAKSHLIGAYQTPGLLKGCRSPIYVKDAVVGYALRTKDSIRPIFVSPGHKMDLTSSVDIALSCSLKYRAPEPIRIAHVLSRMLIRQGFI